MRESLQESVLHGVERIRLLTQESIRNSVCYPPVASEQLFERLPISCGILRE